MCKRYMAWARGVSRLVRTVAEQYWQPSATEHALPGRRHTIGEDGTHRGATGELAYRAKPSGITSTPILLVLLLGMLVMAGCYEGENGENDEATSQPPGQSSSSLPVSFVFEVQPIFTQRCATAGCHNTVTQASGLNLDAAVAFDNIVQVPSSQFSSQDLIEPGDPNNSYLFRKIAGATGIFGTRMPQNNPSFFDQNPTLLALIRQWIEEGARPLSVSFAADIQPILTQHCATSGCHNAATQALGLTLESGVAYDNIVQVPSRQSPSQDLIAPGDPDNSYLFRKITGATDIIGARMPLTNPTFFDQNPILLALVRRWIQEGAVEN